MSAVEVNWDAVKTCTDSERVEEYMYEYWDYMDENKIEDGDKGERVEIIKRLRELQDRHG